MPGCARHQYPAAGGGDDLQGEALAALNALPHGAGDATLRAALAERLERERLLFDTSLARLVAGLSRRSSVIGCRDQGADRRGGMPAGDS